MIDKANLNKTDKVIDLCGGNARLTKELIKICDDVSYLDQEIDMIPSELKDLGVTVYNQSVQDFIETNKQTFDKVFCEQAVNYWLLHIDIKVFSKRINKGGLFIFNTFSNRPSTKPMIKQYKIDDVDFLEISYLIDNIVQHIQIRENYEPHLTSFDWISKDKYLSLLSPYFNIEIVENGKSAIYICKKK